MTAGFWQASGSSSHQAGIRHPRPVPTPGCIALPDAGDFWSGDNQSLFGRANGIDEAHINACWTVNQHILRYPRDWIDATSCSMCLRVMLHLCMAFIHQAGQYSTLNRKGHPSYPCTTCAACMCILLAKWLTCGCCLLMNNLLINKQ